MANPLDQMQIRQMPNARGVCFGMVRNGGHKPHQGWDLQAGADEGLLITP